MNIRLKDWLIGSAAGLLFLIFVNIVFASYSYPAFYFREDTLFWCYEKEICPKESNFLKFFLDKKIPPTVNEEPIKSIWIKSESMIIITDSYYWELIFIGQDLKDWYVNGPFDN